MIQAILTGAVLGLALIFSVGPVIFTIIKLRINYGVSSAYYFISGVWLSDIIMIIAANIFGNFFTELVEYKTPIGITGGILLIGLGIYYAFIKKNYTKAELDNQVNIGNTTNLRLFLTGFLINTLNPGVLAVWMAAAANTIGFTLEEIILAFAITMGIICLLYTSPSPRD